MTRLKDIGEFGLLARLQAIVGAPPEQATIGIGDDCAVWRPSAGHELVLTCDTQVEGRHFLPLTPPNPHQDPTTLGRRCATVNLSDLAAMAATPRFALVSLGLPPSLPLATVEALYQGLHDQLLETGASIIGGNITSTQGPTFVDITLAGEVPTGQAVTRSGAKPGDLIGVTGMPGASAAGLACLQWLQTQADAPTQPWHTLLAAYLRPQARLKEAQAIAPYVSAMLDLSDGIPGDLQHLLQASQCSAQLQLAQLPTSTPLTQLADLLGTSALDYTLGPSDDYELLFCAPPQHAQKIEAQLALTHTPLHWLGTLTSDLPPSIDLVDQDSSHRPLHTHGWTHF